MRRAVEWSKLIASRRISTFHPTPAEARRYDQEEATMFPNPLNACDVKMMEHKMLLKAIEREQRCRVDSPTPPSRHVWVAAQQFLGGVLGRIAALAHDSRDGLRSKEQELAVHGMNWTTDPAFDEALAHQIDAARLRRRPELSATAGS
jgi:hypothetical protein